ncbi:Uncharacterised protein [Mycobacterium tuberculosis]|nr:Uncharacterised protein [Mycobacterium tuberculosis]
MIKRALRHPGRFQQLTQPHAGKAALKTQAFAGSQKMFAGIMFSVFVHDYTLIDRPVCCKFI